MTQTSTDTQTTDRLNTLSALVQLASFKHLPGPSEIRMQPGLLMIVLDSHDAAIAWCEELGTDWNLSGDEIWNGRPIEWRGWGVLVHSRTEQS